MEKTLYASVWSRLFLLFVSSMGVVISLLLMHWNKKDLTHHLDVLFHVAGWILLVCSALWMLASVLNLFPSAWRLKLDSQGLTATFAFCRMKLAWKNAESFWIHEFPGANTSILKKWVVFLSRNPTETEYYPPLSMSIIGFLKGPDAYAKRNRKLYGFDGILMGYYGLSPEKLADLLNEWRMRAAVAFKTRDGASSGRKT